ncbi:ABC transporter substrate-binding protein [Nocardiopsis salina]|uniref:ABC transporter substrate-binding protein n=1 Tax=Nocardiopsis salina TaxID=245836 RepID=UPI0003480B7C|nr:ABC transporter substrate-binding protein [Nocardiopsis salina]
MTGHTAPLAATALALVVAATGCSTESGSADDMSELTLRVGDQIAGAEPLLEAAGELEDTPYEIEWSTFTSGPPLLEAMHADAVDIGQVGNTPPVFAAAADSSVRIVSAFDTTPDGTSVIVPTGSDIEEPADLQGASVAVARGSSAHGLLLGILDAEGLDFDDLDVNYVQPADALASFSEGEVDAWATWDPYVSQAGDQAEAEILVNAEGHTNTFNFQVASEDALGDPVREAAVEDYVERINSAVEWSREHPEEYAQVWAEHSGLPAEITELAAERREPSPRPVDAALIEEQQVLADNFAEAGEIPSAPDMSEFVDDRFDHLVPSS